MLPGGRPCAPSRPPRAGGVPGLDARPERGGVDGKARGDGIEGRSLEEDRLVEVARAEMPIARRDLRVVPGRRGERIERAPHAVEQHQGGHPREALADGIVELERPMPRILHVGLVFVHEAAAVPVEEDPRHRHVLAQALGRDPVRQPLHAHPERIGGVGMPETVGAVIVPQVPEPGARGLAHADAVAGVRAHRRGEHRLQRPDLRLQGRIALKAAAGHHDAAPRRDGPAVRDDTRNRAVVDDEALGADAERDRDAGPQGDVAADELEEPRAGGRAAHRREGARRIEGGKRVDIGEAKAAVAGERDSLPARRARRASRRPPRKAVPPARAAPPCPRRGRAARARASCRRSSRRGRRGPRPHPC